MRKIKVSMLVTIIIVILLVLFTKNTNYNTTAGDGNLIFKTEPNIENNKSSSMNSVKDYKSKFANIIDVVRQMNVTPLLVTLVNRAYLPFAFSWLCNTEQMGIHKQVLFITTDTESKDQLNKLWPNIRVVAISGMSAVTNDQAYSHAGYIRLMIRRTQILLDILQNNIPIFLFEVDCLWIKNPVPSLVKNEGYDILVNPVSNRPGVIAGGFIYMFPTHATKVLWAELNAKLLTLEKKISNLSPEMGIPESQNDQMYLSDLVKKRVSGLKPKYLPLDEYADGKWYSFPEKIRATLDPYVINNNWVIGNKNKILRAKSWGHWFVLSDNTCDRDQIKNIVKR
ncbi:uncharacterized protein LOC127719858 [Mytilus californianus]|uniref:uncharacterized protein LOC127719858 n=1 Tax=Mytilus californianus TaxID=6549 RepID=UPI002246BBC8|nr:uncharacterized protein LOC127719858 [Mytilus californianus]